VVDGIGLVLDYWGPSTVDIGPGWVPPGRVSFAVPADYAPVEYASTGTRQVHHAELVVDHGAGLTGAAWTFEDHTLTGDGTGTELVVGFRDTTGSLRLDLHTAVRPDVDVIRRWVVLRNVSADRPVTLRRAMSGGWSVPAEHGVRLSYLAGAWGREFTPQEVDLRLGTLAIGSRQGITGHLFTPVMAIQPLDSGGLPDQSAGGYGVALAWSGSWQLAAEGQPNALVRVSAGLADDALAIPLAPGESWQSPETLGVYATDGPAGVTREWQRYQRTVLARSTGPQHRPVVYNSWYATGFAVRPEHQLALAEVAARLGVEVFVVDDGWFSGRDGDTRGLGDWQPDPAHFPAGLDPLIQGVLDKGMRFGLWIEPEAVNPDSALYRAHPDWIYRAGDRTPITIRNQYVLDLGRPEVLDWIEETLRRLLSDHSVSYLKWDMNRPVTDGGRPGDPRSGRWSLDHVLGYYRVMAMLRKEFPAVTVEACAGGGARIDPAVLALSDVVWPSDETGPRDRLVIQDGFLRAYPPHVMSSWVTDEPGTLNRAPASLGFRFVTAMAGVLGIGADILRWDEKQCALAADLIELYKEIRPVLHDGTVHTHGRPDRHGYAVEYARPDRVVVLAWETGRVRLASVAPERWYRLRSTGRALTGAVLRSAGIAVPFAIAVDADVLVFDALDEFDVIDER
jgi:alpha-galactosidase